MKKKAPDFPLTIAIGSVSARIYRGENRGRPIYTLTYSLGGERQRKNFAEIEEAKREAYLALTKIANGESEILQLTNADRENYVQAMAEIQPLGVSLLTVAKEYRNAVSKLGSRATLNDAVRFFLARDASHLPQKTVAEVVTEMLKAKLADGLSRVHLCDSELRLARFSKAFSQPISEISTRQIEEWLRGLNTGPRNRNNFAGVITTLFRFARRAGYLSPDRATAADSLQRAKATAGAIEIYTPDEIRRMLVRLQATRPELVPFIALGAFAGLRTAEICRLEWSDINFKEGFVVIGAEKAKTASRRLVPIQPNLAQWLAPYMNSKGKIAALARAPYLIQRGLAKPFKNAEGQIEAGLPWKHNGLRHSFASYRLAACKNAAEVALEMGNSPRMVFAHYREIVSPAGAADYWTIVPGAEGKIISFSEQPAISA